MGPSDDLCAKIATEQCDELIDPVQEDAVKTAAIWGQQYSYCQLKHELLIECRKADKEKAR